MSDTYTNVGLGWIQATPQLLNENDFISELQRSLQLNVANELGDLVANIDYFYFMPIVDYSGSHRNVKDILVYIPAQNKLLSSKQKTEVSPQVLDGVRLHALLFAPFAQPVYVHFLIREKLKNPSKKLYSIFWLPKNGISGTNFIVAKFMCPTYISTFSKLNFSSVQYKVTYHYLPTSVAIAFEDCTIVVDWREPGQLYSGSGQDVPMFEVLITALVTSVLFDRYASVKDTTLLYGYFDPNQLPIHAKLFNSEEEFLQDFGLTPDVCQVDIPF